MDDKQFTNGKENLSHPAQPLVRIIQFLFLTGPFTSVEEIMTELNEPIETNAALYKDPRQTLHPYLDILKEFELIKNQSPLSYAIFDENGNKLDLMTAIELWVSHQIITRELETINSRLCGPCGCTLCCLGPEQDQQQQFFEIPLAKAEVKLFPLSVVDTTQSRKQTPYSATELQVDSIPFYQTNPTIFHWQTGWSMILPKETACPNLAKKNNSCEIYPNRPAVCRRPQIFSYLLERRPQDDQVENDISQPAYTCRQKLLAIWDCPYVQALKEQIAAYAEMCELEPIFKENKT